MIFITAVFLSFIVWIALLAHLYKAPDLKRFDKPEPTLVIEESQVSPEHKDVVARLDAYLGRPRTMNAKEGRRRFAEVFSREVDIDVIHVDIDGMDAEWVCAGEASPSRRLLYIHGGAFIVGSPKTHRHITAELSRRSGLSVLAIDYRMQPEFKMIHCHEDARKAYGWILNNGPKGRSESAVTFVAGDSAGGNLTLALIAWARDQGWQQANGAIAFAPSTDITMSGPSWKYNRDSDPFLGPSIGRLLAIPSFFRSITSRVHLGIPASHPHLSPLFGHLEDLPPTLIQVSQDEMLYSDALRYTNKARSEGSEVTLQAWPTLVHVFQGFDLPEADQAFSLVAKFIQENS